MPSLPDELFSLLENKTLQAREAAEKAARNILAYLKVENGTWWGKKEDLQRDLWLGLRARARQLGYSVEENSEKDPVKRGLPQLVEEIAYEQWHRMLFARFLAENHLLMHPSGVAVSLAECEELAPEEGEDDAWRLAARYASAMLPGIFKLEDPCAQVRLTPSDHHALESILLEIPPLVFTCDDALGWMYQFWQSKKKDEVNTSERKIGGADLAPVTQLFTEDYMVRFLLENSLGAWWAARHPESPLIKEWGYLRFKEDGTPAAGTFPGWPERVAEVTIMDPCCGSGHFLVAAFDMLRKMRMEEEMLTAAEAVRKTFHDNLFGLEIDQRCTQIAYFSLSLIGWKTSGYQTLSDLNVACTGIAVKGQLESWLVLAGEDSRVKAGLERLYNLFKDAPDLGSLINPTDLPLADRMFIADYDQVGPLFEKALLHEKTDKNINTNILGFSADSLLKAVRLLSTKYTLIATNVPFLGFKKQSEILKTFSDQNYHNSKMDLATVFIERCLEYSCEGGTVGIVSPHNWLFLKSYQSFRKTLLKEKQFNFLCLLGGGKEVFRKGPGNITGICASILTKEHLKEDSSFAGIDVSRYLTINEKYLHMQQDGLITMLQKSQLKNPDNKISISVFKESNLLSDYAICSSGMLTSDSNRFYKYFWEFQSLGTKWEFLQSTCPKSTDFSGMEYVVLWEQGKGELYRLAEKMKGTNHAVQNWRRGQEVWGKRGIAVSSMGDLAVSLYNGNFFDNNLAVICPIKPDYLPAIWYFCKSDEFHKAVRQFDKALKVTTANLVKIHFDINKWNSISNNGNGIPEPYSFDPSQWLFFGNVNNSIEPLQTAVPILIGYNWPQQKTENLSKFLDEDGISCLPAVNGEPPAAERLRALLAAVYGDEWSGAKQEELLAAVGYSGKDLADWLRDSFFEQHCKLFQNRPFVWHIWDGRKDGFSALVNYHNLDRANLEKLTYTYLGSWITDRKKELERGAAGAEGRLLSAQALQDKLKLILAGEPPYDIYVRWKPLNEQPIGWEPDLNDGVRLNIRPFVTAGVLRSKFTINWNKDRGKNPDGSERLNDLHFTIAEKRTAREKQRK